MFNITRVQVKQVNQLFLYGYVKRFYVYAQIEKVKWDRMLAEINIT